MGVEQEKFDSTLPTLIVLHGGPGIVDHQIEVEGWRGFSSFLQVVFLDQRGCGRSEDGDLAKWNLKQCAEDVYQFAQVLEIEQPIVAGVSWGGYVAMSYAISHPDHPLALIFCNTEAKVSIEAIKEVYAELGDAEAGRIVEAYYHAPTLENFERFVQRCLPHFSKKPFALSPPHRVNMEMRVRFIRDENLMFDFREKLKTLQCPVLLLAGDRDPAHPKACAEETARYIPKEYCNLYVIPDSGAPVYQDQSEEFCRLVSGFLEHVCALDSSPLKQCGK